jgi:hypothetical protein
MEVVRKKRKGQKLKGWDLYKGTKIETQINYPCFFLKKRCLQHLATFWFSELEDARDTWCLRRQRLKGKVVKSKSDIRSFKHFTPSEILIVHKIQDQPVQQHQHLDSFPQVQP